MPFDDYLFGFIELSGVLAGVTLATGFVLRRRYSYLTGSARLLAGSLIAIACLVFVHLVPGVLGVLNRGTVICTAVALALASSRIGRTVASPEGKAPSAKHLSSRTSWALAGSAVFVTGAYFIAFLVAQGTLAVHGYDSTNFHLPTVGRWIQTGSLWQVDNFVPGWAFGNYPNNGNLIQLAFILPWHNDAFVRYVNLPFLALAGMSVYGLAVELGAARATATTFAAAAVAVPTSAVIALDNAMTDPMLVPFFTIGVLFLLRYSRTGRREELALAGVGLGLALGTKWYGLPYASAALLVFVSARQLAVRQLAITLRDAAMLAAWIGSAGGFWLVRNLMLSGNPLFPQKIAPFGITIFDAPHDAILSQYGFSISNYLSSAHVLLHSIFPSLRWSFGLTGGLAALGLLASFAVILRARATGSVVLAELPARAAVLAIGTVLLVLIYFVTPYTAQGPRGNPYLVAAAARYALPPLMIAAALSAWACTGLGRWRFLAEATALGATLESIRRYAFFGNFGFRSVSANSVLVGIAVLALLAAALVAAYNWRLWLRGHVGLGLAAGAFAALLVGGAGWLHQRAFNRVRYRHFDATFDWMLTHAPAHHRIGLAGGASSGYNAPPLVMFGPRYSNTVKFIGPTVGGLLQEYQTARAFDAALARGRFDLLLVGKHLGSSATPQEVTWARGIGFTVVARSERYTMLRAQWSYRRSS